MKRLIFLLLTLMLLGRCYADHAIINAFSTGELSPYLRGRTDVKKYYSGCETLENMIVLSQGGATKRPGSYYIAATKSNLVPVRLITFEYSTTQAYVIEMGNLYFRFYMDGGQIMDGGAYEIVTPYLTADLFEIQYIQSADKMFLVHPDYAPQILTRSGHTSWTLTEEVFIDGPFRDENTSTTTITPSGTTGSITLEASGNLWYTSHVGALWQLTHTRAGAERAGSLADVGVSNNIAIRKGQKYDYVTHGTWAGTIILQRSYDASSTWKDVVPFSGDEDGNISYSDSETVDDAVYRINRTVDTSGTIKYSLIAHTIDVHGVVEITARTDLDTVTATVMYKLGGTGATKYWAQGAFSNNQGFPGSVAFYEERICYAGTTKQPQTLFFSQTDDWDNFLAGSNDTDAITLTIASDMVNAIRWMIPQTKLLIGTTGSEWTMSAMSGDETFTPTNVSAKRQSSFGSANIRAIMLNHRAVYVQRQLQKIRKMEYSFELDNWISPDLTILSEHITGDGVIQIAMQRNPYPILWAVREDGVLLSLTLEESQQIVGWARHVFKGKVESVAVLPGAKEDEVWIAVRRVIDTNIIRHVERIQPFDWGTDQEDAFFVNSGLTFVGTIRKVSGITKYDPATVSTTVAHGFSDGDQVRFSGIVGMTELNNRVYTVDDAAPTIFSLDDADGVGNIDSTGFTTYVSGGTVQIVENTFTTLSHLDTETVALIGDGGYLGTDTVASNTITLDDYYNTVHIGVPYTAKLQPMKLEVSTNPGTLFGRVRRLHKIDIRFHKTGACDIGPSWDSYDSIVFRDADDPLETATPLYTGLKTVEYAGDFESDTSLCIQSRFPTAFTVLALKATFETDD